MFHGIINEQGYWLEFKGLYFRKNHMFTYKYLVSGAQTLSINSLVIIKPMYLCHRCYE